MTEEEVDGGSGSDWRRRPTVEASDAAAAAFGDNGGLRQERPALTAGASNGDGNQLTKKVAVTSGNNQRRWQR